MIAFRLCSFAVFAMVISSFTESKVVSKDQLNGEIDQDLAGILEQDDTPDSSFHSVPFDKSVLEGFVPRESAKDMKETKTVETLKEDDAKRKLNKLLDYLSKDESQPPMDMPVRPAETDKLFQSSDDQDEKIPEDLLDDLKSAPAEVGMDIPRAPGTIDSVRDEARMGMPVAAEGAIPRFLERMHSLHSPRTVHRDEERMDMPEVPITNERACPNCHYKKELNTDILMDELLSRMKSYVKRGEQVPRRMVEILRKYREKRRFKSNAM